MLYGIRINLKPLEEKDIETTRTWRNKYSDKFFDSSYITKEQQRQWYERFKETHDYFFIIQLKDKTPIGTISLYNINIGDRTAVLGRFLLLDEHRHHGYAEEAVGMVIDMAERMGLFKIKVEVHLENIDAIAIYARAGFKTQTKPIIIMEKQFTNQDWDRPIEIFDVEEEEE